MREILQNLLAVPTVISAGEHIDAILQKLVRYARRDAKSRRGILAVGNHQIDLALRHDVRQPVANDQPPRRSHNVSDKEYAHELVFGPQSSVLEQKRNLRGRKVMPTPESFSVLSVLLRGRNRHPCKAF